MTPELEEKVRAQMLRYGYAPVPAANWHTLDNGIEARHFMAGTNSEKKAIVTVNQATNSLAVWPLDKFRQITG